MGNTRQANVQNGPTTRPIDNGTLGRFFNSRPGFINDYICGTDAIDQAIQMLRAAQMINWATLGQPLNGGSSISDLKNPLRKPEQPGRPTEAARREDQRSRVTSSKMTRAQKQRYMSSMPMQPASSERGSNAIEIGEGIASLMEGLHTIAVRNRAAQEVIEGLEKEAPRIRRMIPLNGGVLVRINLMVSRRESDEVKLVGVFVDGVGKDAETVARIADAPRPLEWRAAPTNRLDPEVEMMMRKPEEFKMVSTRLWVVVPCINLHATFPPRPGTKR